MERKSNHEWHVALNQYNQVGGEFRHWMYDAKQASTEVPRLTLLFKKERTGELTKIHRQCSHSEAKEVVDNHLTCAMGQECRKCPHLLAIEKTNAPIEDIDEMKAWTCATHILVEGKDCDTSEGMILTEDDKIFWSNVYENMSRG